MSKNKVSSNKDTKDINSLEEDVKIDSETDTEVTDKDVNDDEDISIENTVENKNKEIQELKDQ